MDRKTKKVYAIGGVVLVLFVAALVGWNFYLSRLIKNIFAHKKVPPVTVSTLTVAARDWHPYFDLVGTLGAAHSATISTEVAGVVQKTYFASGDLVKQGQVLVQLDDGLEQYAVKEAQAARDIAAMVYRRHQALRASQSIAQGQLDEDKAHLTQAEAVLGRLRLQQQRKKITAPFNGRIGMKKVSIGDYVKAGSPVLDIQDTGPLEVAFSVPERWVHHLRLHQPVRLRIPEISGLLMGEISEIDAALARDTHTLSVAARLHQSHPHVHPGMFAEVQVLLPFEKNTIMVPQTAVIITPYGNTVYVVAHAKVYHRAVELGPQEGNALVIRKGLQVGEQIVTAGQLKLQDGVSVIVNNQVRLQ